MRSYSTFFGGSPQADFAYGPGSNATLMGGDGSDVLIAAIQGTEITLSAGVNQADAVNLTAANRTWYTGENPLFFDNGATPHFAAAILANPGGAGWFSVTMGSGATLTVDIDYAGYPTDFRDIVVEIRNSTGFIVASNDDVNIDVGGLGSIVANDPFVSYTAPLTGVYYIVLRPYDAAEFSTPSYHQLHVSLTGQPSFGSVSFGNDILYGEMGTDQLGGGAGNDVLFGDAGFDWLMGGSGNDLLQGGSNGDRLEGGTGDDIFRGTGAEMRGDIIVDFDAGDLIYFNDATLGAFTHSLSGTTLTYTGGSLTLATPPIRGFVAGLGPSSLGVQLSVFPLDIRNDISGDKRSDFFIRDAQSGWLTDWLGTANGSLANNGASLSVHFPADWKVAGTGDYNGDGRDDLLLRSDAGWLTNWLGTLSGGLSNNGANTSLFFTIDWKVVGNGDFNRDGRADLLLRRDDGWLTNWLGTQNGSFSNNGINTSLFFTTDWKIASTGDFNGDGYTDILLRRDDGWLTNWLGNSTGSFTNNGANTSLFFTLDWKVIGTGDVNGDGRDDLLLRRDDGWITDWLGTANGGFTNNGGNTALYLTTDWKISSIADFNGDGREDLLLRHDSGWMTNWLGTTTGSFANNGANFSTFIAPNWVVQDPFM